MIMVASATMLILIKTKVMTKKEVKDLGVVITTSGVADIVTFHTNVIESNNVKQELSKLKPLLDLIYSVGVNIDYDIIAESGKLYIKTNIPFNDVSSIIIPKR